MRSERDDPLAPPSAEEEREAQRLRRALDAEAVGGPSDETAGSDEIGGLARTARLVARQQGEPMPEMARARTLRRVLAAMPERRPRWQRLVYAGVALAAAASVAVVAVRWDSTPDGPRAPYAQVFRRPFTRDGRPADRLAKIIAWRRGRLDRERGR